MIKRSNIKIPNQTYTDIWGYEKSNGQKFAVVGTKQLTTIYDVTDCGNPIQVFQHNDGFTTVWRDYKVYGNAIYGTADQSPYNQGLQVFNMDNYTVNHINTHFLKAHNIYIDTANARLYVAGSNSVYRGLIVYDVSNPLAPTHLKNIHIDSLINAPGTNTYVHDLYVKDNIAYTSSGYISRMYQLDVSDINNVQVEASYVGPSGFNHSGWATDDGTYIYEALEVPKGKPINIYRRSVTNQSTLQKIGEFKDPLEMPNSDNNRPHNPFIHEDKLYISYYEDGVQVYDISNPVSPTRIAYYDTYPTNNGTTAGYGSSSSFNGCWGIYPFLSSGCILANDIEFGFYTLELDLPDPQLESNVKINKSVYQSISGRGIVLRSNKGYCFRLGVNTSGNFELTRIVCQSNQVIEQYVYKADLSVTEVGETIISKNSFGSCYKLVISPTNEIMSQAISCPNLFSQNVNIGDSNLVIDTYTKGLVVFNPYTHMCVRIRANDDGTFSTSNLSSCP
ncbi:MAG: choice-of-anchor B family protein [Saprospiraceae bacterium]